LKRAMRVSTLCCNVVACLLLCGCALSRTEPEMRSRVETVMGTLVEIKVVAGNRSVENVDRAIDAAFDAVRRVDSLMSNYREDSEVSRINRYAAEERLSISAETTEVIGAALKLSRESGGAFDITVLPLLEIWGFAKGREKSVPSPEQIAETLRVVGYHLIDLDPANSSIKLKNDGVRIDLGGIAKGYAVDCAVKSLVAHGMDSAIVNAGGDMYCLGDKSPGKGWRVGVTDPRTEDNILGHVEVTDKAVATSGDYRNYFEADGIRYSHILDPRTGRPTVRGPRSATVVAGSCAEADGLATAVFVLGRESGLKLLEKLPDAEGLIVSGDTGHVEISSTAGWNQATSWKPFE